MSAKRRRSRPRRLEWYPHWPAKTEERPCQWQKTSCSPLGDRVKNDGVLDLFNDDVYLYSKCTILSKV